MPKRRRIEDGIQIAIGQFLDVALPVGSFWCHVPNGGLRSKAEAARFKAMGVKPGVPDLLILAKPNLDWTVPLTIWIEVKSPKGRATDEQIDMQTQLAALGCDVFQCRSPEEVERVLRRCSIPLRASFTIEGAKDARERNG